jgi:hypothetical protein
MKQLQLHIYPMQDSGKKHTPSTRCRCHPDIDEGPNGVVIALHQMVGDGPNEWTIQTVTKTIK